MIGRDLLDLWQIWMGLGILILPCLLEESQHDRNIVLAGPLSLNSVNKQIRAAVMGLIA